MSPKNPTIVSSKREVCNDSKEAFYEEDYAKRELDERESEIGEDRYSTAEGCCQKSESPNLDRY